MGADLGRDLARSGSNPDAADFQIKMRQPVYDCYAADRERARLPQGIAAGLLEMLPVSQPRVARYETNV